MSNRSFTDNIISEYITKLGYKIGKENKDKIAELKVSLEKDKTKTPIQKKKILYDYTQLLNRKKESFTDKLKDELRVKLSKISDKSTSQSINEIEKNARLMSATDDDDDYDEDDAKEYGEKYVSKLTNEIKEDPNPEKINEKIDSNFSLLVDDYLNNSVILKYDIFDKNFEINQAKLKQYDFSHTNLPSFQLAQDRGAIEEQAVIQNLAKITALIKEYQKDFSERIKKSNDPLKESKIAQKNINKLKKLQLKYISKLDKMNMNLKNRKDYLKYRSGVLQDSIEKYNDKNWFKRLKIWWYRITQPAHDIEKIYGSDELNNIILRSAKALADTIVVGGSEEVNNLKNTINNTSISYKEPQEKRKMLPSIYPPQQFDDYEEVDD